MAFAYTDCNFQAVGNKKMTLYYKNGVRKIEKDTNVVDRATYI